MAEWRLLHPFTFCIFLLVVMTSVDLLNLSAGPLARSGLGLEVRPCPGRTRRPGEFRTRKARTGGDFGACQRSREFSSDLRCSKKVSAY
jgi:hypothetical protein